MLDITVIILTKNEAIHLERCLQNMCGFVTRVVVVDSFSIDETKKISLKYGVDFYENHFVNYAKQFQWALDNCEIATGWIMRLDADEYFESDLKDNLIEILPKLKPEVVGINLQRRHIFWKRWIRYGGRYPLILLRIWRTGFGRIEDRWMDEHIIVWGGRTINVPGGFCDENLNDLTFFTEKHNKYATREAIDVLIEKYKFGERDESLTQKSASVQAAFKRFLKERFYNKLPFQVSAFFYFIWRYIFQLGFLDGTPGITYHFLQGFWYRFLVGAKLRELEMGIDFSAEKQVIKDEIFRLTGHKIL